MTLSGYSNKAKYFVELVGLAKDSIGDVIIDEKYALIQLWSDDVAAIVPPTSYHHPTFDEVVFYTNFLTYSHEIPVFIYPEKAKALTKPIEKGRASFIDQSYYASIRTAYEIINSLRLGPLAYVYFRWSGFQETIQLPITRSYSNVSREISLYSTAIRQLDPLSEFLSYYRIIESVSGDNGKNWILANLNRLESYDFGFLEFEIAGEERVSKHQRRKNLFSFYRRRALSRLKFLNAKLSNRNIAEYFYNENRCGIAHGKTEIKTYDFGFNIKEISQDLYILKLLARIAIEDNAN